MAGYLPGRKVTYVPFKGADPSLYEKGMVKSSEDHGTFVVFHCNNDWENYANYTAQLCNDDNLSSGWV